MAYDLVTWSPRVGSSGDDKYNPPGSTKLDATFDTGLPTRIDAGLSSYSSTPTISEINSGSGLNQVIALYNRRQAQMNALRAGTPTPIAYLSSASPRIAATTLSALYTAIGNLRTAEGFTAYTFPTAEVVAGKKMLGTHLAHARKSLQIAGIQTQSIGTLFLPKYRQRDEVPYGTISATTIFSGAIHVFTYGGRGVGQAGPSDFFFSGLATGFVRIRAIWPYAVYDFMDSSEIVSAELQINNTSAALNGGIGEIGITATTKATTSVTPASADYDAAYVTSSVFSSTGAIALPIPAAQFAATGVVRQVLLTEQHDTANSGGLLVGISQVPPGIAAGPALPSLVIDWG